MMIVVKVGGRVLESNFNPILNSVAKRSNENIVLIHGGGDTVSRYSRIMGIKPEFIISSTGIRSRFTDEKEIEVYSMVICGKIGKEISAYLNHIGVKCVNLSGVDGRLLEAKRKKRIVVVDERGRKRVIEGGYTGTIVSVNKRLISSLIELGYVVVVSPLALGDEGELLNVDGDSVASVVASAVEADMLIFLTSVDGVIIEGKLVDRLSHEEVPSIVKKVGPGMNRKLLEASKAIQRGVRSVLICSGLGEDPLSRLDSLEGTLVT